MRFLKLMGALLVFVGLAGFAKADHMNGRYQGVGEIAGVILDLQQNGNAIRGTLSGSDSGTLEGQTDGGNNAQGVVHLNQANVPFVMIWAPEGIAMRLQFQDGPFDVAFVPGSGQPPQGTPPSQPPGTEPTQPPPQQTGVEYYVGVNGQQVGPLSLDQVVSEIQRGAIGPKDLVWKTGAADWAPAESYPELAEHFRGPPPLPPQDAPPADAPPPLPPGGGDAPPDGGGLTPPSDGGPANPPDGGQNPPPDGSGTTPPSDTGTGGGTGGSGGGTGGGTGGGSGGGTAGQTPSSD